MKNLVKFFAVALLGIAAACNEKELAQEPVSEEGGIKPVYENLGTVSFTAQFENKGTKGYDAQGKVKWEVGDYIIVAPKTRSGESSAKWYPDNDTKIQLTSEMISADGKTASFSIDGLPTDVPGCYAISCPNMHGVSVAWDSDFCWVNTLWTGGFSQLNTFPEYGGYVKPHLSFASCEEADTRLTFKNVGAILKWDTRVGNIGHVDFVDNSGAAIDIEGSIDKGALDAARRGKITAATQKCYTCPTNSGSPVGGPYYIFLWPHTYAQGISLYFYSGWSGYQDGATPVGKIVVDNEFVAKAGDFWDLGYVEDHYAYDTYKEAYDAGQTIKIGNLSVNKATYGNSQLITSDARFYPASGVAFIDPSASGANLQYWSTNCIVIGNDPAQRSSLEIRSTGNFPNNGVVAFKNLDITFDGQKAIMAKTASGNTLDWFAIDNCKIDFHTRFVELYDCGLNNLNITNSDIVVCDDCGPYDLHRTIVCRGTETDYTGQQLVFRNNLVTTESTTARTFGLISKYENPVKLTFNTVDFSQNTIFNVNAYHFLNLGNIVSSFTMSKNLIYDGGSWSFGWLWNTVSADATVNVSGATGNKLTGYVLRCNDGVDLVGTSTAGWYDKTTYPFAQGNNATVISTRDYTPITALSGYGVTNPKRLQ